jgi:hypothetical protein
MVLNLLNITNPNSIRNKTINMRNAKSDITPIRSFIKLIKILSTIPQTLENMKIFDKPDIYYI